MPMSFSNKIWQKLTLGWGRLGISSKFGLGGILFLLLILMVASTGYIALMQVKKAEKSILTSANIQRLILDMDRGMEKSRRLYRGFFLQYPIIGFEKAHQEYIQPSIRQIAQVITTSRNLKQLIVLSPVSVALQNTHIDLNLYLSSAKRFASTSIETVELVTNLSAPDRGFETRLMAEFHGLKTQLTGQTKLLHRFYDIQSYTQEYRIARKRFLMQSAFNGLFTFTIEMEKDAKLPPKQKEIITQRLAQIQTLAEEILKTDVLILSKTNDIALQEKAIAPISASLIQLAMAEMKQAEQKISQTHTTAVILMAVITFLGIIAARAIATLLDKSITQKLICLTREAGEFRKGNLDVFTAQNSRDEIGQLAGTFNLMAIRIKEFIDQLELKVSLRTHELKKINHQLQKEVDERIQAQENFTKTQALLQAALDNSQAGILIADAATGNVQYINDVGLHIMGETKDTIPHDFNLFTYVRKFIGFDPEGRPVKEEDYPLTQAINHEKPVSQEYVIRLPDKTDRYIWANASPIKNHQGKVYAGISFFLDITERKKAEKEKETLEVQLLQAQKMEAIGTLAGGIAHDFNNILAAILGYADLAMDDIPKNNPARDQIQEVLYAGNRARDLVKQILAFSRKSQKGRIQIQIHRILREVVQLLRASIPSTITIDLDADTPCPSIQADPTQIHQVILNLCTNAAQAMEETGGTLSIALGTVTIGQENMDQFPDLPPGPHVRLSIKDTGPGISKKIIDKIFDPYFTTKEVGKGSGMGLAMVHGIVKSHKGMVVVHSTTEPIRPGSVRPGKGTEFQVILPGIEGNFNSAPLAKSTHFSTGSEHILVVDDEAPITTITKARLERLGYQVTGKTDSQDALNLFRSHPHQFDLVITDQTMPHLTGEQMAREMLRIKKDIPIILCTGYSSMINKEKAKEMGISAFIMKPADMGELSESIRRALDP